VVPTIYCSLDPECPSPLSSTWLGAIFGAFATALFFIMITKHVSSALEELRKLYVARTCVMNLIDIFGKKDGEGRIRKDEHNRQHFLRRLNELYLKRYDIKNETINNIYVKADAHQPITSDHDHSCPLCREIMDLIKAFNSGLTKTIEDGAHTRDWM
jgi:hypothetical protein